MCSDLFCLATWGVLSLQEQFWNILDLLTSKQQGLLQHHRTRKQQGCLQHHWTRKHHGRLQHNQTRKQQGRLQHHQTRMFKFKNVLHFKINIFKEHCISFIYWPMEDPHCLPCIIILYQFSLPGWVNSRCLIFNLREVFMTLVCFPLKM